MKLLRALIADRNKEQASNIADWLQKENYLVDRVTSGYQAMEKCRLCEYDIILAELELPGINGVTLLYELQKAFPHNAAKIILMCDKTHDEVYTIFRTTKQPAFKKPICHNTLKKILSLRRDSPNE